MKHVLIVCNRLAPSLELDHVARALAGSSKLAPLALLGSSDLDRKLPAGALAGVERRVLTNLIRRPLGLNAGRALGFAAKVGRALRLDAAADFLLVWRAIAMGEAALDRLLREFDIAIVVVADDRSLGFEYGIVHAAAQRSLPSIAVPFALSDPNADWIRRSERPIFDVDSGFGPSRWLKRQLANRFPGNVREQGGRRLMFLTAGQVLGIHAFGRGFPVAWAYGGGATDFAAVFDETILHKQISLGVSPAKLVLTGQCSLDALYRMSLDRQERRRSLDDRLGLDPSASLIICAVPQYGEHGMMDHSCHSTMSSELFRQLRSSGANVLLSLHPRSSPADYADAATQAGAVISPLPLIDVLAAADLFVATHSSTVRWAILLGVPVIILDDFGVGAAGMFGTDGIRFLSERSSLNREASLLLHDLATRTAAIEGLQRQQRKMGLFDGRSSERLLVFLATMAAEANAGLGGASARLTAGHD